MSRHIPAIAVLLIVHGAFDLVLGLALTGTAVYVGAGRTGLSLDAFPAESVVAVTVFGPALLGAGVLKIVAGARNYRYRGRLLGIAALASGAFSAATCLCAPTALALMACGIAVYMDKGAAKAFLMGEQGLSREWIAASLAAPGRVR